MLILSHQNQQAKVLYLYLFIKEGLCNPAKVHLDLVHLRDEIKTDIKSLELRLFKSSIFSTLALIWCVQPLPTTYCTFTLHLVNSHCTHCTLSLNILH